MSEQSYNTEERWDLHVGELWLASVRTDVDRNYWVACAGLHGHWGLVKTMGSRDEAIKAAKDYFCGQVAYCKALPLDKILEELDK